LKPSRTPGLALAFALVVMLAPLTAAAEPAPAGRTSALSWVRLPGAEGCIGAPALASRVEARLGRRVFVPPADAEISIEGTVAYRADTKRFKAAFRVADRTGTLLGMREVEESVTSCDKLDERFAFVLSVLIDPDAALAPTPSMSAETTAPSVAAVAPAPAPEPAAEPALTPAPARAPRPAPWRWLVGADFGAAAGVVPDVGFVLSGNALLTPPHWPSFHAKGSSYLPASRRIEGNASAEISVVTGELGICPLELRSPPFGIVVCLDGLLGQVSGRGNGFAESRLLTTLLGGIALQAIAELAVSRSLALTLSPSLVVPLTRARLAYDDAAGDRHTIFEVAPVGGSLALGIAVGSR
jgi:hypothetical protein